MVSGIFFGYVAASHIIDMPIFIEVLAGLSYSLKDLYF